MWFCCLFFQIILSLKSLQDFIDFDSPFYFNFSSRWAIIINKIATMMLLIKDKSFFASFISLIDIYRQEKQISSGKCNMKKSILEIFFLIFVAYDFKGAAFNQHCHPRIIKVIQEFFTLIFRKSQFNDFFECLITINFCSKINSSGKWWIF